MGQLYKQHVQLASVNFVTGTWAYTANTTASPKAGGLWAKSAADNTPVITVPFGLHAPSRGFGAKLISVTLPIIVGTADLDAVITATLTRYDMWKAPRIPAQTFTVAVNGSLVTFGTVMLPAGTAVTVSSGTTLPAGLATSTTYYVGYQNPTAPTISTAQLFTTYASAIASGPVASGDLVSVTDTGTGTHTITSENVTATNIPITLTGSQIAFNAQWRELKAVVTTPAFLNTTDNTGLIDASTFAFQATVNCGASTVLSVDELPWVEYETTHTV